MNKPLLISIFAESATGKTTLSKKLVEKIGEEESNRIPVDYYLKSNTFGDMLAYYQDDRIDWEFLENDLNAPIGTKVFVPDYDFNELKRNDGRLEKLYMIKKINILDALYPYLKADLKIFLKISDETRKKRMISRHNNERNKADKVTVDFMFENWDKLPRLEEWLNSKGIKPDLVLDSEEDIDGNVQKIKNLINFV